MSQINIFSWKPERAFKLLNIFEAFPVFILIEAGNTTLKAVMTIKSTKAEKKNTKWKFVTHETLSIKLSWRWVLVETNA